MVKPKKTMYVQHVLIEVSQLISESKDEYYDKLAMKLNILPKLMQKPINSPLLKEGKIEV